MAVVEIGMKPAGPNGQVSNGTESTTAAGSNLDAAKKPAVAPGAGGAKNPFNGILADDEVTNTLAAASEKLQAAHRKEQERKSPVSRCLAYPKKILTKLRDLYINTCMIAAEKGDFVDLVAGHPGMIYGDAVMSRNVSQRRDRDLEDMQASLSRQVSISLSRQQSSSKGPGIMTMTRSASAGLPNFSRNSSARAAGLNRQTSAGGQRTFFGGRSSSRAHLDTNLYSSGRTTFLQQVSTDGLNGSVASLKNSATSSSTGNALKKGPE